jgi:hypothetical protein
MELSSIFYCNVFGLVMVSTSIAHSPSQSSRPHFEKRGGRVALPKRGLDCVQLALPRGIIISGKSVASVSPQVQW